MRHNSGRDVTKGQLRRQIAIEDKLGNRSGRAYKFNPTFASCTLGRFSMVHV